MGRIIFQGLEAVPSGIGKSLSPNKKNMMLIRFKRFSSFIVMAGIFCTAGNAQVKFGVKTGLSISEILTSNQQTAIINGRSQSIRNFPKTGFAGGVFFSIPLTSKLSLQPELTYANQGAKGNFSNNSLNSASETYKLDFLNIPLLLQYRLPLGFFVETGPQWGLLLKARIREDLTGSTISRYYHVKDSYKSTDFGWVAGAGYISPVNIGFDIRYTLGLSDFSNGSSSKMSEAPIQNGSIKNSVVQISLFYLFGKTRARPAANDGSTEEGN